MVRVKRIQFEITSDPEYFDGIYNSKNYFIINKIMPDFVSGKMNSDLRPIAHKMWRNSNKDT